jgi:Na+/proline symporter
VSTPIIILTIAGYITLLFVVAWLASRHSDNATFFTGGRKTPRMVAAIAMVGAAMSGVTYISVPGTVLADHFSYLQTTLGFFVGYLIIAFVLVPLYYRLGVVSLYEYLDHRFGVTAHRTGAWLFFLFKIIAASLRAFVVCVVLQALLFDAHGIPFAVNATIMMLLVWLYTRRGGVKSVVWSEMLKSVVMVGSIVACIIFIINAMDLSVGGAVSKISTSNLSEVFFMDDPMDRRYFWKQFIAGIFLVVAMTGMDQDMMQTVLSCRSARDSQRSLVVSIVVQMVVILLFLALGALFYLFLMERGVVTTDGTMPLVDGSGATVVARGDDLFGYVATECGLPMVVGVLFLLGLVASTYSAAGSALTALTTSFTLDILNGKSVEDNKLGQMRRRTHLLIAVAMTLIIVLFYHFSSGGVITLIFTMASYTYGPLLGMFLFGLLTKREVKAGALPIIAIVAPLLCYILATNADSWFGGYEFSYEIIVVNAALTMLGMWIARK